MRTLVDTQCYYWSLCEPSNLSVAASQALQSQSRVKALSVATFWEMSIKSALGKLTLPNRIELLWHEAELSGIAILSIRPEHLTRLAALPHHHRDPFDRLMIAQALEEGWEVVSSDDQWDAYGVMRIW
ncbi:MAG: type II toxin-antitoxin system VapC family toxin [Verrucomicrobiota bacterium]